MTLGQHCTECIRYLVQARGYSETTMDNYGVAFSQFRGYLQRLGRQDSLREFTTANCRGFVQALGEGGTSPNTILGKLAALSTLARYLMQQVDDRDRPLLTMNPTKGFDWPQAQAPDTAFLLPEELRAFLEVPLRFNEAAARDLLVDTGLRASELCRANVEDLLELGGRWVLAIAVKGRGTRKRRLQIPVSLPVVQHLHESFMARKIAGRTADPLLVNQEGRRYRRQALNALVRRIAQRAAITRVLVGPHTIRHTLNVIRKHAGVDRFTRSRLLGQSDPRSQDRYDHVMPGELHDAKDLQAEGLAEYLAKARGGAS